MRFIADRSVRLIDGGHALVGGSPLRIVRLTSAGAALVAALLAGEDRNLSAAENSLIDRLVDGGLLHPQPSVVPAPRVSVVIPTRNRRVGELACSLPMPDEVIVVDDGSDPPLEVAIGSEQLRVLRHDSPRGPAAARNTGWRAATGEVVVFLDSDCAPRQGWLGPLLAHFLDPRVVAAAPRIRATAGDNVLERYDATRSPLDLGDEPARVAAGTRVSYVPTAALVVRRDALEAAGGFDEDMLYGEDVDLVWRLAAGGGRVRYEPSSVVDHPTRASFSGWLRQRFDYGTSAAPLAKRHPGALAPLRISPWSALAWGSGALVHPLVGVGVGVATTATFTRKLSALRHPWHEAFRLAGVGNLLAGRQIADALVRTWWPLALVAAFVSKRARRVVLAAAIVPHLIEWVQRRPRIDPLRWVALRVLDDVAYGAGVWAGCLRERTIEPLMPGSPSFLTLGGSDPVPEDDRRREQDAADGD